MSHQVEFFFFLNGNTSWGFDGLIGVKIMASMMIEKRVFFMGYTGHINFYCGDLYGKITVM